MAQCDRDGTVKVGTDSQSNESTTGPIDPPTGPSKDVPLPQDVPFSQDLLLPEDAPLPADVFAEVKKNIAKHKAASLNNSPSLTLPPAIMMTDFIKPETFEDPQEAAKREKDMKNEFARFHDEQARFGKALSDEQFNELAVGMGNFERNDYFDDDESEAKP